MAKRFGKHKVTLQGNLAEVSEQLGHLAHSDRTAETGTASAHRIQSWGCVLLLIGGLLAAIVAPTAGGVLFVVALGLLFIGGVRHSSASAYDLENMRYEIPDSLLKTLAVDLDPERPIQLQLDFRASQSPQFKQKVEVKRFLFFTYGPSITYFSHPWLELSASTVDGHRIKLTITRDGTYKSVPKRKRTKTRMRYWDVVQAVVRPASGAAAPTTTATLDTPQSLGLRSFRGQVSAQGATAKAVGPVYYSVSNRGTTNGGSHLGSREVLGVLISCFRGLTAS